MKSKEFIEEYIYDCDKYGYVEYEGELWKSELELIHKDLEILEILKKHLLKGCYYKTDDGEAYDMICLLVLTTQTDEKQDFDKIKEWLENDIH